MKALRTTILNTYSKIMRVTLFSKNWWKKEVVKLVKYMQKKKDLETSHFKQKQA